MALSVSHLLWHVFDEAMSGICHEGGQAVLDITLMSSASPALNS